MYDDVCVTGTAPSLTHVILIQVILLLCNDNPLVPNLNAYGDGQKTGIYTAAQVQTYNF